MSDRVQIFYKPEPSGDYLVWSGERQYEEAKVLTEEQFKTLQKIVRDVNMANNLLSQFLSIGLFMR